MALARQPSPAVDLRCPIWASGTRSRIIRQASYTMVEGSNCIVFTTLPMLIFSERATMVAAGLSPLLRHLLEETDGLPLAAGPSGAHGPSSGSTSAPQNPEPSCYRQGRAAPHVDEPTSGSRFPAPC